MTVISRIGRLAPNAVLLNEMESAEPILEIMTIPSTEVIRAIGSTPRSVAQIVLLTALSRATVTQTLTTLALVGCIAAQEYEGDLVYVAIRDRIRQLTELS